MTITPITSPTHFSTVLSASTYVVADFYADWCGPCKAIAPVFSELASAESKPGRIVFVKVDVDGQQRIAKVHEVSAMPTFLIFKNGKVVNTLRGADPSALRSAVLSASADSAKGPAKAPVAFTSKGRTLGSNSSASVAANDSLGTQISRAARGMLNGGFIDRFTRFFGLYFTSLFSLDPYAAAEGSMFNVKKPR